MSNKNQPLGVDISSYNGKNFDTEKLKQTTAFAIVRAGVSWGWEDPIFTRNWQGLQGHNRAAYHVVYPSQDAISQAQHFLEIVQNAGADWEHDRLALDLELAQGQSKTRITQVALDMMEHIKARTGRYPILYSRAYWVNDHLYVNDNRLKNADWWVANYLKRRDPAPTPEHPGPPILPRGINKWLIHQTSERGIGANFGRRDGIIHIDLNRWNGTIEELNAYFGRGNVPPVVVEPEPEPEVLFRARVTARRGLIVRVGPDTKCLRIGINPEGTMLDVYEVKNGWYRISPINQEWSAGRYTERLEEPEPPADPVDLGFMLWSQRDPRWANIKMGSSGITIGEQGCLVTAVATCMRYLGVDTDPGRYAELLNQYAGYAPPNLMYWLMPDVLWGKNGKIERKNVARAEYRLFSGGVGFEPTADLILADKRPVLAMVDMVPGGAFNQHWVLVIGKDGDDYRFIDPWYGDIEKLSKRYQKIYRLVGYEII